MKITIEIRCDSAAFSENGTATEAVSVIKKSEEAVADGMVFLRLRDTNGQYVGQMVVSK